MVIDKDYIPQITSNYSCVKFNSDIYTICIDHENSPVKLNVNRFTKVLLDQIDGQCTIEQLTSAFNKATSISFTTEDIISIFNNQLLGYGILEGDNSNKIEKKDNYINFRFTVFPAWLVGKVVPYLSFLFERRLFTSLFVFSFGFLLLTIFLNFELASLKIITDPLALTMFVGATYGSLIFHEFGHAAACHRFGAKSGDIGFGFYLFTPVFYADITDAWRLQRHERVIVDLGGIYFQSLICAGLALLYHLTGSIILFYLAFSISLTFIVNINPFLRFDGYWALSDLLNIYNLRDKAYHATGILFGKVIGKYKGKIKLTATNIFLMAYGLTRIVAIILFVGYMVVFNHTSVLYFPVNLYKVVQSIAVNVDSLSFTFLKNELVPLLSPFILYFMVIKSLISSLLKKNK